MSTPSEKGSTSATSPPARSDEFADTASSVQGTGAPPILTVQEVRMDAPPSPPQQILPLVPNATFDRWMKDTRLRSVSPRPRRVVSPSLSVAQMRARTAEWKADTAISTVGQIADQTIRAQSTADDTKAEARAVREEVESRISALPRRAEITTSSVVGEITSQVR